MSKVDLERAEIISVEPGDVVVLTLKGKATPETLVRVTDTLGPIFKEQGASEVIVLDSDARLSVVRGAP